MTNLYRLQASSEQVARHFGVDQPAGPLPSIVRPGELGAIVRGVSGVRTLHVLKWGFPRIGRNIDPTIVNLIADLTNFMWEDMVPDPRYRCLVPLTAFGQPQGPRGQMTRTWFSIPEWPLFALAGFCRRTPEFGNVFGAMTGASNNLIFPLNDRSPIILAPDEYDEWMTCGIQDVIRFQFRAPFPADRLAVERSTELWVPRGQRAVKTSREEQQRLV